jgi:dolichol-phosphate mannosyltransferase
LNIRNVRDYTCGYRLYRTASLQKVRAHFGEKWIQETGFACMVELLYKLYLTGAAIREVPFSLRYDEKLGNSKMQVARTTGRSLSLIRKLRRVRIG